MDIGPYISELLQQQKYVVLPGFGAFVANYRPARFDVQTARLLPPSRTIAFRPELNLNDGILLNYVARAEDIPAPLAHKELEAYCDELLYQLDHNQTIVLNCLGKLNRNGQVFRFEAFPEAETLDNAFGLEPIHPASLGSAVEVAGVTGGSTLSPNKKKRWWLYAAIFILLVAAGGSLFFILSQQDAYQPIVAVQNTPSEIVPPPGQPEAEETTPPLSESPVDESLPIIVEITHPAVGYHYVVGGSFKTEENATKYISQLTARGSESLYLGWINNFYLVAIAATLDEDEAIDLKNKLLTDNPKSGIWIYMHKE